MSWQRLKRPPIKEAVLDIKFEQVPADALAKLNDLARALQKDYPINNHYCPGHSNNDSEVVLFREIHMFSFLGGM